MTRTTTTTTAYTRSTTPPEPLPSRLVRILSEARWMVLAVLTAYLVLILITYDRGDPGWSHASKVAQLHNWGGPWGAWIADLMLFIFGLSAWWWCVLLMRAVWGGYRRLSQKFILEQEITPDHRHEKWISGAGFALMMAGSVGIEWLRMYTMPAQLPRAPGGVLGDLIGHAAYDIIGFNGATLILLALFGLGFSLFFQVSWLSLAERIGTAIEFAGQQARRLVDARADRKLGQEAAVKRDNVVVQERARIVEAPPIR
ncbi:MAG: DNA translocase FtsK 4TM domain-containing protein, partial [Lacisediminimonas sp.]|nr:DNA translocase FtsK 4TM domain-containing protein [Lacisediminimonas sp.]